MIEWSSEQREMRAALRSFVTAEVDPRREELESGELPPYELLRSMFSKFGLDEIAEQRLERSVSPAHDSGPKRRDADQIAMVPAHHRALALCARHGHCDGGVGERHSWRDPQPGHD